MTMNTRNFLTIGAFALVLLITMAAAAPSKQVERGQEWMSWSPAERSVFMGGFIDGYLRGSHEACKVADDLFEVGKPHRLGDEHHPSEIPSVRCEARLETYSKYKLTDSGPDFSAYTVVITEFYTKHPEYQGIPYVYLLSFLSDSKYKTADQLHEMALKGEIRTNF
jgi:hypothetical protein